MKLLAGVLGVMLLGLTACTSGGLQAGEGRLVFDQARVQVAGEGERLRTVAGDVTLHRGDRVKVVTGEAELKLGGGGRLLLQSGSELQIGRRPTLLGGEVVAVPADDPLSVRASQSQVDVLSGAVRVRQRLGVTAGVYAGSARLTTAGRSLAVPAYRQATIPTYGVLPNAPSPLTYKDTDRWDLQFLGLAIELSEELRQRSEGFTAQLRPGEGTTLGFYRLLLPDLASEPGFADCATALPPLRPAGETLVGTSIALQATGGSYLTRCRQAFAFRDEGASWGLVALDQDVQDVQGVRGLRELLADAVGRLPATATFVAVGPGVAPPVDASASGPAPASPPADDPTSAPPPGSTPSDGTTRTPPGPVPTVPPLVPGTEPPPPPEPPPGLLEPLLTPVEDTLDGLLDALLD